MPDDAYVTPPCRCPSCGYRVDRATMIDGNYAPRPGDVSVCIECATPLIFTDGLLLRLPTDEELKKILPAVRRVQQAIRGLRRLARSN